MMPAITSRRHRLHFVIGWLLLLASPSLSLAQADGEDGPDYSRKGADSCFACHDDQATLAVFRSSHAVPTDPRTPFGHDQLQCEACHGPGGEHAARVRRGQERPGVVAFGVGATGTVAEQNAFCIDCHGNDTGLGWHGSAHDDDTITCAGCHSSHAASDPVLQTSTQANVCYDCHQQQRTQGLKPFAHVVDEGKMDCGSCHNVHDTTFDAMLVRQTLNQTCHECHAETRGPHLWEHAPVAEDCSNCHDPHGSNHPGMLTMRGPMLCQSCHSQAGHPSLPQDADSLPSGMASQYLLGQNCMNCHGQVHGSNHPSGSKLMR